MMAKRSTKAAVAADKGTGPGEAAAPDRDALVAARCARQGPDSIRGHEGHASRMREEATRLRALGETVKADGMARMADDALRAADLLRRRHSDAVRAGHPQVGEGVAAGRVEVTYRSCWEDGSVVETPAVVGRGSGYLLDVTPAQVDPERLGMLMAECIVLPDGRELDLRLTADGKRMVANVTAMWPAVATVAE